MPLPYFVRITSDYAHRLSETQFPRTQSSRRSLWDGSCVSASGPWAIGSRSASRPFGNPGVFFDTLLTVPASLAAAWSLWEAHFKTGGGEKSTDTDVATVMSSSLLEAASVGLFRTSGLGLLVSGGLVL